LTTLRHLGARFAMSAPPPRHFLQFRDFSPDEFAWLFERTRWI
jgi:hypothetical protein